MGRCVAVKLKDLRACSDARVEVITATRPSYWDTDENVYDLEIPEQVNTTVIARLWPNIQLTLDVNLGILSHGHVIATGTSITCCGIMKFLAKHSKKQLPDENPGAVFLAAP